jgi:hypothetical protein
MLAGRFCAAQNVGQGSREEVCPKKNVFPVMLQKPPYLNSEKWKLVCLRLSQRSA